MTHWWKRLVESGISVAKVAAVVAVPAALLFTHVQNQYRITELGYKISEQTERREHLQDEHRKLRIETTVEGRSERLSKRVRQRFNLEPVEPEQIVTVEMNREDADDEDPPTREHLDETEHARLQKRGSEER